ncbi:MFS transporter [Actinokineospora bangkokensis]|uniref:MFS transporter n=1 Tax=Actinokineospora bangkokensis TaxID=1193682 RepID=A0A1Q9LL68_9PSEU|nr:MFS transporter [Actinokineospora bangkokensis]OLR92788.1 MFS transporter [Actinokineospora bangkokensis]
MARTGMRVRQRFDRRLIAPMVLGSALNPVNSSMLAVALVPIGIAFGAPPSETAWLVTGLYLATAVGQPVIGRLVDAFGPRPLYLLGTGLVGVAGVLGVLAPRLWVLVLARVLLGFGTSAAFPASMSLLRTEAERTGMASPAGVLATLSASSQVISAIGPTLGGFLIGVGGWHLIFAINVPLSLACLALGWLWLPRTHRGGHHGIDVTGMALFAAALTSLMLFLMLPGLTTLPLAVVAVGLAALFARRELGMASPFLDLRVLAGNRPLLLTYLRQVLSYITAYAYLYGFTQWLEHGRGLSPQGAGLAMLPMSGAAILATAVTGRSARVRGKLVVGGVVQVLACLGLLVVDGSSPVWVLAGIGVLVGIPQGLNGLANQNALYAQADAERMGASAGLLRTCTYLGALVSAAVTAAFFHNGAGTAGLHGMSWLLLGVAGLLVVVSLADRSLRRVGAPTA